MSLLRISISAPKARDDFLAKVIFPAQKAGFFLANMINPEKNRAVERFTKRIGPQIGIINSINFDPALLKDRGFRDVGIETVLSLYKSSLYRLGLQPSVIAEGATRLIENLSNGGRKTIGAKIKELSELSRATERQTDNPVGSVAKRSGSEI